MKHIVALSGGKDSTAMALRLAEVEPRDYEYVCTPTADESGEMNEHWRLLGERLGKPLIHLTRQHKDGRTMTLDTLIDDFKALPNNRQRWCTRMLKIEPMIAYLKANQPAIQYVGLRADEELREGIYSTEVESDFPMRRWGWGITEVLGYLKEKQQRIPERTDCLKCYDQRLHQWRDFYEQHRDRWLAAEQQEALTGATFRSPSRDTWPAPLSEMAKEFERGRAIRGDKKRRQMLLTADCDVDRTACRVCSL